MRRKRMIMRMTMMIVMMMTMVMIMRMTMMMVIIWRDKEMRWVGRQIVTRSSPPHTKPLQLQDASSKLLKNPLLNVKSGIQGHRVQIINLESWILIDGFLKGTVLLKICMFFPFQTNAFGLKWDDGFRPSLPSYLYIFRCRLYEEAWVGSFLEEAPLQAFTLFCLTGFSDSKRGRKAVRG